MAMKKKIAKKAIKIAVMKIAVPKVVPDGKRKRHAKSGEVKLFDYFHSNRGSNDGLKRCTKCDKVKSPDYFHRSRRSKDGYRHYCKECTNAETRKSKAKNREKRKQENREWRASPKGKVLTNSAGRRRYRRAKSHLNIARPVRTALQDNKHAKIFDRLGYTQKELRLHLEVQFEWWMTWGNFGGGKGQEGTWSIDHIIPVADFPQTEEGIRHAWTLGNLRPLDARENNRKSYTRNPPEEANALVRARRALSQAMHKRLFAAETAIDEAKAVEKAEQQKRDAEGEKPVDRDMSRRYQNVGVEKKFHDHP